MPVLAANLTAVKNEAFYANNNASTYLTSVKNEVLYVNPNPTPPTPGSALLTTSKFEALYGGIYSSNITVTATKLEVLRTLANEITYAELTTVKHEALYSDNLVNPHLTANKMEVLYQSSGADIYAQLTSVKHEVLFGGRNSCTLTATKMEVLRSLIEGKLGTPRRLLVLWNPEDIGK